MIHNMKTRIIGVFALAAVVFATLPAVLFPDSKQEIKKPNLAFNDEFIKKLEDKGKKTESVNNSLVAKIELTSVDSPALIVTEKQAFNNANNPIKTISLSSMPKINATNNVEVSSGNAKKIKVENKVWLRVASLENEGSVVNLVKKLEKNNYEVTVYPVTVNNKKFKRVLVGPFSGEKSLKDNLDNLIKLGYKPESSSN